MAEEATRKHPIAVRMAGRMCSQDLDYTVAKRTGAAEVQSGRADEQSMVVVEQPVVAQNHNALSKEHSAVEEAADDYTAVIEQQFDLAKVRTCTQRAVHYSLVQYMQTAQGSESEGYQQARLGGDIVTRSNLRCQYRARTCRRNTNSRTLNP